MMCALPFLNHSFGKILEVGQNGRQRKPLPDWGCLRWAMWSNCVKAAAYIFANFSIVLTFLTASFPLDFDTIPQPDSMYFAMRMYGAHIWH